MNGETPEPPVTDGSRIVPGDDDSADEGSAESLQEKEIGGREGPDPTRFGDWEKDGRCIDF